MDEPQPSTEKPKRKYVTYVPRATPESVRKLKRKLAAQKAGRAAQANGKAHRWTPEEGSKARGLKGTGGGPAAQKKRRRDALAARTRKLPAPSLPVAGPNPCGTCGLPTNLFAFSRDGVFNAPICSRYCDTVWRFELGEAGVESATVIAPGKWGVK